MPHFSWHDYLMVLSLFAAIGGLGLLFTGNQECGDDREITDRILLMMSFTYWLVYCVAFGLQKCVLPQWDVLVWSIKLTGVISYLLTFACVLSLPLHRVATRQPE